MHMLVKGDNDDELVMIIFNTMVNDVAENNNQWLDDDGDDDEGDDGLKDTALYDDHCSRKGNDVYTFLACFSIW